MSPRGRLYPPGSVFELLEKKETSCWFKFKIPNNSHGFVIFSNKIFNKLTEEEKYLRALREKNKEEHIKKCEELFIVR